MAYWVCVWYSVETYNEQGKGRAISEQQVHHAGMAYLFYYTEQKSMEIVLAYGA